MQSDRRERRKILAAIDMTPLMDLTFMLLIIFIITVPAMYYKTDVSLTPPESNTNDKVSVDAASVFVELDKNGEIWLNQGNSTESHSVASANDLTLELTKMKMDDPDMTVFLVGDQNRQYKEIVEIANAVQRAHIDNLSLVFNPEKAKK